MSKLFICSLFFYVVIMQVRTASSEQATTFSSKEVTILASSWTGEPEELAEVLGVQPTTEEEQATNHDIDKCSSILQQWLDQSEGDRREKLVSKFEEEEYHGMATLMNCRIKKYLVN